MIYIIGSGIQTYSHITKLFDGVVRKIPVVLYSLNDPLSKEYIKNLNVDAYDLDDIYFSDSIENRIDIYAAIADKVIGCANKGDDVVYVDYGHPLFFNKIVELIIKKAEEGGIATKVYPAISAEDCLFADLKISPCDRGWMSFDASNFLNKEIPIYTYSHLILWQVGMINFHKKISNMDTEKAADGLYSLLEKLSMSYGKSHNVILYEASLSPLKPSVIIEKRIKEIDISHTSTLTTMYVPPQ